jgi:hypothetical protein
MMFGGVTAWLTFRRQQWSTMNPNLNPDRTHPNVSDRLRSEVSAILVLLKYARLSLQARAGESAGLEGLNACIDRIQNVYHFDDQVVSEGIFWNEEGFAPVVRLLEYLKAEIAEKLRDEHSVAELEWCIDFFADEKASTRKYS